MNEQVKAQVLGSGIGAAASIGGGILQTIQANRMQQREMEYNERMIDKQNQYNSPANQMRLLQQAGLNPNSIFGSNSLGGMIQSSAPSAPEAKRAQWDAVGAEIANISQDAALKSAQVESIRHDTERKDDAHEQEYGEDGFKSKYFNLESMNSAAQRALWGSYSDQAKKVMEDLDDQMWNRSFQRIQASMNNYVNRKETLQRMEIAAKSEKRAQQLFPYTLRQIESEIGKNKSLSNYYAKSAAFLSTQNEFFRSSNLMDFQDGIDSIDSLGVGAKKTLLELKLINNRMMLEGYKGVTEQRNWNLIDQRISYYGSLGHLLDLKADWQEIENVNKNFELIENRFKFFEDSMNSFGDFMGNFMPMKTKSFSRPYGTGTFTETRRGFGI